MLQDVYTISRFVFLRGAPDRVMHRFFFIFIFFELPDKWSVKVIPGERESAMSKHFFFLISTENLSYECENPR